MQYTDKELKEILEKHWRWLCDKKGGERADLQGAYLQGADLQGANLQDADLRRADLQRADLQRANLQDAYLSKTILDGINWLAYIGIVPDHQGTARAFKIVNAKGEGIYQGGICYDDANKFKVVNINTDIFSQCGTGINLATFQWCLNNKQAGTEKLIMFSFNVKDAVCPVATDGKFRVSKCRKIGECDWKGNLLKRED